MKKLSRKVIQTLNFKKYFVTLLAIFVIISNLPLQAFAKDNNTYSKINEIYFSTIGTDMSIVNTEKIQTDLPLKKYLSNMVKSSDDPNAGFKLNKVRKEEIQYFDKNTVPSYSVIFTYTDEAGKTAQTEKYFLHEKVLKVEKSNSLKAEKSNSYKAKYVETIYDIGNFAISLYEYNQNPSFWNGFWLVVDGAAVVFPGVPAVSGVKRMIQDSPTVLKPALRKGVRPYSTLQKVSAPSNFMGQGWERHHIFEKRFAGKLGTTEGKMLSIFIPKYNYHYQITQRMSKKIPWYAAPLKSKDEVIRAHIEAYGELWAESGFTDEYWEFLYKFSQTKQYD
ncbi:hypothetical protein [Bacillus sp. 03113]|uniref:hypothetical protein n=1 Tax=Bacillus sp. 03113 TaxID=2578211 RepID=UPI0011428D21|nr:hypothetical protein [Bacillus sp. 03113]